MTLDSVQPWQVGEYECVASVQGFTDAKMKNYLHLKGLCLYTGCPKK